MIHDRKLVISTASHRDAKVWAATETTWGELAERLKVPIRGTETHEAYLRMKKPQQDALKDVGGFLGGTLRNGRRKAAEVTGRGLITLDLDTIRSGGTDDVLFDVDLLGCAACVYSTRKHDAEHPRLRVILPLARALTGEEYEPAARKAAEKLGIEKADPTCFRPNQMMYWPNVSCDSEYVCEVYDKPLLDPDALLAEYRDWRDALEWPGIAQEGREGPPRAGGRQEDPEAKKGVIGAFCREYDVRRAMDELLPGVYAPTDDPDRYTYTQGSTTAGAIVYEDKWLYSHHATDPVSGQEVNAWDLVRLHKFGGRDAEALPGTPPGKLPSWKAMSELALSLPDVKRRMLEDKRAEISEDFGTALPDGDWRLQLAVNARGEVLGSLVNLKLIFENDEALFPIGRDTFQQRSMALGPLPWNRAEGVRDWTDDDDTGAAWYAEAAYGIKDLRRIKMACDLAMADRSRDALKEYLEGLKWDGVPRVDTLLVKYLLAEDTPYTRAVTRKALMGAVARGLEPGIKFDTVLTLVGAQGSGKSMLTGKLGGPWHSDSIQTFTGKEAAEQLRGIWIAEIPELDRFMTKYDSPAVKQFITRQDDIYREAYGRRTTPHPRRCVFIATVNEGNFLIDPTGNRRWWIVQCHATSEHRGADIGKLDRDQVWAEAVALYRKGEALTLEGELSQDALMAQEGAREEDAWDGMIAEFAARKVPPGWDARPPESRRAWWADEFGQRRDAEGLTERKTLCAAEIWVELFGRDPAMLDRRTARRINNALRRLEGWYFADSQKTVYGKQKCFVKDRLTAAAEGLKTPVSTNTTKTTNST